MVHMCEVVKVRGWHNGEREEASKIHGKSEQKSVSEPRTRTVITRTCIPFMSPKHMIHRFLEQYKSISGQEMAS